MEVIVELQQELFGELSGWKCEGKRRSGLIGRTSLDWLSMQGMSCQ